MQYKKGFYHFLRKRFDYVYADIVGNISCIFGKHTWDISADHREYIFVFFVERMENYKDVKF